MLPPSALFDFFWRDFESSCGCEMEEEEGAVAVARRNRGGADGVNLWILFAGAEETSTAAAEVAISSLKIDVQEKIDYVSDIG